MPLSNKARQKRYREKTKNELEKLRMRVRKMELKMYSIRDSKAEIFNAPFYKKTHGEAERDFTTLVNDEKSTVAQYPDDFDLYYVGTYDDGNGKIEPLSTPQHIVKAIQLRKE